MEEVVYLLDVQGAVPATMRADGTPDGGVAVGLGRVAVAAAQVVNVATLPGS